MMLLPLRHNKSNEIEDHQDIYDSEAHTKPSDATNDFVNLPREEGGGNAKRQVLGPGLFENQSYALDNIQRSIGENSDTDPAQPVVIDHCCLIEQETDKAIIRVEAQIRRNTRQYVNNVLVYQLHGANTDSDEQNRFQQFEDGNGNQTAMTAPLF